MKECELCGDTDHIDMHHTSYEPEETIPLCRSCHREVHGAEDHELQPDEGPQKTTIPVDKDVKNILSEKKKNGETWNKLLLRLAGETDYVPREEMMPIIRSEVKDVMLEEL